MHQEAKASETHQPLKTMINNNLFRNQVKTNWEDITRKSQYNAMTFELENKATGIHPQATNWLDNNDGNVNSNLTRTPSLVNGGWKENYGDQWLDSNVIDSIKIPSIQSSNLIDIDSVRIPEIHLIEPPDLDLVESIAPDTAFLTDIADRQIGMADAAMERMWGSMMAGISSYDWETVGHTNTWDNSDGHWESTNTTYGSVDFRRNEGEYQFTRMEDGERQSEDITEEEYFEERQEAEAAANQSSTNNSNSNSNDQEDDDDWWFGKRLGRTNPNGIAPWSEPGGGRPPIWFLEQSPEITDGLDSLINQINPHLMSEYLLKEVVTTSLDNRIKDNLLLQDNNTSAQAEITDELTNFDKELLANSVATNLEHGPGFEEPIAADHDVFSFGGMTQSMPSSPTDENILLTLDNVIPQQMLSNNMTTVL